MAKAERYQMGFDFRPEGPAFEYELTTNWHGEDGQVEGASRFTRALREPISVRTPSEVAHHLLSQIYTPFDAFSQEELWTLLLNTKSRITHEVMVYRGNIDSVNIRYAELFREPIRYNARSIILSHCHPSGDPNPSPEDVKFSAECSKAAQLLGINLLDHIVVGDGNWISLRERGLLGT